MELAFSKEDEIFRKEVRDFFEKNIPPAIARKAYTGAHPPDRDELREWQALLHKKGWGAPHWPVEYGGTGWGAIKRHIYMEELYSANGFDHGWQSTHMLAPVLMKFGSAEQKEQFLPKIISGETYWCQGFSEPGSGSDLASLKSSAVKQGDRYIVNGQKTWTSDANISDWGFFLVRTNKDVKPQKGISFFLIDLKSPGVTVRPIESIDGAPYLNEIFLEDVYVPKENLVGEEGMGWSYAKYLLEKERTASAYLYFNKREFEKAKDVARKELIDGVPVIENPYFQKKMTEIEADLFALEWSVIRVLADEKNKYNSTAVVSALKVKGSKMQQRITELQIDALGLKAIRHFDHKMEETDDFWHEFAQGRTNTYLYNRASTIFGGSLEVQKNIIAKLAFGL